MTLREIAKAFDMSVDEFANHIGYSRQFLYRGKSVRNTARVKASISLLRFLNTSMLQEEMAVAKRRTEIRKKAIEEFERLLTKGGADNA